MKYLIRSGLIVLLLVSFATNCEASCDYPIKDYAGDTCQGVLLSDSQFIEASNNKKKLRIQDLKMAEYEGLEELYEMRHKHYRDELRDTRNELKWTQFKAGVGYVISFSLGAIVTGYIVRELK